MAVRVSKTDFEEKVLKEKLPVLVDFIQIPAWRVKSWHRFSEMRKTIMRIRLKYIK